MWVLEADGELLEGKRLWLRPGREFLFGRTSPGTGATRGFNISHKGVSRKHLTISVGQVEPRDTTLVRKRAKVTITDDSKFGTTLDGQKFLKDTILLDKDEHTIRLGSFDQLLKLKWEPVVLTLTSSKVSLINAQREKIEPLGVKLITEFLLDGTTHVTASKRNIPKVLQGILAAKYIVAEAYLDAIVKAARSPGYNDDGETPLPSLLEEDFDANWPNPVTYVPPSGGEPVQRPAEFLIPDAERSTLFEGFTFVFMEPQQHATLEPVLSLGGAKCPLINIELKVTQVDDFVKQMQELAGKANIGTFNEDSPKGVIIVKPHPSKGDTPEVVEWTNQFVQGVSANLDQRSIEQREFLDAVLTKDTSGLKRRLEYEDETTSMPPPSLQRDVSAQHHDHQTASEPPQPRQTLSSAPSFQQQPDASEEPPPDEPPQISQPAQEDAQPAAELVPKPSRIRARRQGTTKPKFTGFDDFDDATPIAPAPDSVDAMEEDGPPNNQDAAGTQDLGSLRRGPNDQQNESQGLFVSNSQPPSAATRGKKRPPASADSQPIDDNEAMDELLPGSRALKKRRLQQPSPAHTPPPAPSVSDSDDAPARPGSKGKSKAKKAKTTQQDLRQRAKEHANAMDKVKRESEERDDNDDEVSKLRNLAIVEEMDVPGLSRIPSSKASLSKSTTSAKGKGKAKALPRTGRRNNDDDRDIDPYAGRKNFKRFRRKGEGRNAEYNRGTRVIVDVEMDEPKDYGIGDKYWMSFSPSSSKSKRKSQSQTQRSSGSRRIGSREDEDGDGNENHIPPVDELTRQAIERDEREQRRMAELLPEELAGPSDQSWVREQLKATQLELSQRGSSRQSKDGSGRGASTLSSGPNASNARDASARYTADSTGNPMKKRPATRAREPVAKRQALGRRMQRVEEESSEEEDDPMAFKLRR